MKKRFVGSVLTAVMLIMSVCLALSASAQSYNSIKFYPNEGDHLGKTVFWQGLKIDGAGKNPKKGDQIKVELKVIIGPGIQKTALICRVNTTPGNIILKDITDYENTTPGKITTINIEGGAILPIVTDLYVELHNDNSEDYIEFISVKVFGKRDGAWIEYPLKNWDFSQPVVNNDLWGNHGNQHFTQTYADVADTSKNSSTAPKPESKVSSTPPQSVSSVASSVADEPSEDSSMPEESGMESLMEDEETTVSESTSVQASSKAPESESGGSILPFIIIGAVIILAGGGAAAYFIIKKKKAGPLDETEE